ncbi:MAG: threonine--tRNA ligase [Aquificota bacterium]|nr:threonine--tRNA ligase [Aquificota bacterium]
MGEKIRVFIDGKAVEVDRGTPVGEVLKRAGVEGAIGVRMGGEILDLQTPLREGGELKPVFEGDPESLEIMRHSLAHIMAQALKELYGTEKVHLGVGPTTEEGFYYDVEVEGQRITEEDLPRIEEKMREIIRRDYPILRKELSREEAIRLFEGLKERYKIDIINRIPPDEVISVYQQGDFVDLCKGPHLPSTGRAGAFKLTSVSGAYWLGRSDQPQLTRIYGIAFWREEELRERLRFYEEAKKRDHRKLGKDLEFFLIDDDVGPGLVIWLPRGATYRRILEDYWKEEHIKRGYQLVYTPHVGRSKLWERSGHLEYYRENMFPEMEMEGEGYFVKPMNCPFHIAIYKSKVRSYRDLPFKIAELGTVYRYEMSGVLHGLMRVRGFTQDDAHIICTPDQVDEVIKDTLDLALSMLKDFGFDDFRIYLSTRPEYAIGTDDQWERSQNALRKAIEDLGYSYEVDEGGGAFYGPKIDVKIKDALGRLWQCSTIQFDFNLPERFDMTYIGPDNRKHRPYMIHRAILGSIERFTGVLLEHYGGLLPLWLSPTQVRVLPIADRHLEYAKKVFSELERAGFRVEIDDREERLGAKIRDAELMKIPYVVVVGDKEAESGTISVRGKKEGSLGSMTVDEFVAMLRKKVESRE